MQPVLVVGFMTFGVIRGVAVYEAFVTGAKEGFDIGVSYAFDPITVSLSYYKGEFEDQVAVAGESENDTDHAVGELRDRPGRGPAPQSVPQRVQGRNRLQERRHGGSGRDDHRVLTGRVLTGRILSNEF